MSNLKHMNIDSLGAGEPGAPPADRVMDGDPRTTTWALLDGGFSTGVWTATEGQHRVIRDQTITEVFLILEGEIELFEDGDPDPKRYGAGDLVVFQPGFTGSWRTLKPVRKVYCTVVA